MPEIPSSSEPELNRAIGGNRRWALAGVATIAISGAISGAKGIVSPARGEPSRDFATVADLVAAHIPRTARGTRFRAGAFSYIETDDDANFDLQTLGGAKLVLESGGDSLPVEAFGAEPAAWDAHEATVSDASDAIEAALRRLSGIRSGVITFAAGRTYRIDRTITIRQSNVRLEGTGARLVGTGRIMVEGSNGAGGKAGPVTGFAMIGFRMSGRFRGPALRFCAGYELADLSRDNTAGTWINVHYCRDGHIRDCVALSGDATKIAFLVLGGENNLGERCQVKGGEWVYAFQIKGGRNNWFRDCSIENVARMKHGFRIRGDAPWRASRTPGDYPFADGGWDRPDTRRATRDSGFANCTVLNSGGVHFLATEFIDCSFLDCQSLADKGSHRPTVALFAYRQPGGQERGLRVTGFRSTASAGSGVVMRGGGTKERMADLSLEDVSISGAANNGIDCQSCEAPLIVRPIVSDCAGDGIALRDCPGWSVRERRVSGCRRELSIA